MHHPVPGPAAGAVAPMGLAAGTPVDTADGPVPVDRLLPGTLIVTPDGLRPLRAMRVALRPMRPVLIPSRALGHQRPQADLWLAPDQPVVIRDWRAAAIYGRDAVRLPAANLVDGRHIRQATETRTVHLFSLIFETPQVIRAGGLDLAMDETVPSLA